jgi:hypothetical protein
VCSSCPDSSTTQGVTGATAFANCVCDAGLTMEHYDCWDNPKTGAQDCQHQCRALTDGELVGFRGEVSSSKGDDWISVRFHGEPPLPSPFPPPPGKKLTALSSTQISRRTGSSTASRARSTRCST